MVPEPVIIHSTATLSGLSTVSPRRTLPDSIRPIQVHSNIVQVPHKHSISQTSITQLPAHLHEPVLLDGPELVERLTTKEKVFFGEERSEILFVASVGVGEASDGFAADAAARDARWKNSFSVVRISRRVALHEWSAKHQSTCLVKSPSVSSVQRGGEHSNILDL